LPGLIWCHSGYSFNRGTARLDELVDHATSLGWKSLALTDLNGIYGAVWFWDFAQDAGLRPIIGAELRDAKGDSAMFLVKNSEGYKRLCLMLSARHLEKDFSLRSALREPVPDLVVLTNQEELALSLAKIPELDFYVLLPPHRMYKLARFAEINHLRTVAANPVYYLSKEDRQLHHMLRAIDLNTSLSQVSQAELAPNPAWMPSPEEFKDWFSPFPQALKNLDELVEKCSLAHHPWGELVLFDFDGMSREECMAFLARKVREGAAKRYGEMTLEIKSRIDKELCLVRQKGFASYFLIIEDIVKRFPVTCGRGSAAASIIAYCLFITHVDPIRHQLFFERFLSPGRKDPPDIDVDFPWDERDNVLDYVFKKYGPERTAMVSNHLCFQSRAAMREVGRVFGIPEPEISRVTKKMRGYLELLEPVPDMQKNPLFRGLQFDPPWDKIVEIALRLEGLPHGMSVHCGGVVIAENLKQRVPLQPAAKGVNVVQWEKDQTEDAGLVKLDLLGNRSLAVIRDSLQALNAKGNLGVDEPRSYDYATLNPIDDPATQKLIASGRTMGIFYIESPATCQLQKKAQVGDFEHIVIHSSIIRPAAHKWINAYVKRLRGEKWTPIDPRLDRILEETFGIMVYQEDVMKVAHELAGFTIEEADELRRILSKKHRAKKLEELRLKFFAGTEQNNIRAEQSTKIWEMIQSFSGYSFCKSHSASYAMVSFKSAWLKTYHQAEFLAAVISNQGGYYSAFAYISEARRQGIQILPPDINRSRVEYIAEPEPETAIRVGFMQIKGLEAEFAKAIALERESNGQFQGLLDCLHRLDPDPEQVRLLIKAGCFDALEGVDRRTQLLWIINAWAKARPRGQKGFFLPDCKAPAGLRKLSEAELLRHEEESFGFLISRHPLTLYRSLYQHLGMTPASEFKNKIGQRILAVGWCVTGKYAETSKGELMEFVSFEDESYIYETVFFPDAYRRYCHLLHIDLPYLLFGRLSDDLGAIALEIDRIKLLSNKQLVPFVAAEQCAIRG
jgi:error-prone DNA polymerase